jgi:hypothetical protein
MAWVWVGVTVVIVTSLLGLRFERGSLARYGCAAVQASAMGALIIATVLRMKHLDELQRRIQLESIALAFAVGAAVITGWGYFETAGAPRADWGLFIWPFFIGTWLASLYAIRRRYR